MINTYSLLLSTYKNKATEIVWNAITWLLATCYVHTSIGIVIANMCLKSTTKLYVYFKLIVHSCISAAFEIKNQYTLIEQSLGHVKIIMAVTKSIQ